MEQNLKDKLKPLMEDLVYRLIQAKPDKPAEYMLEYLLKKEGYTSNGITLNEKKELEDLRKEIINYRKMEEEAKADKEQDHDKSFSDEGEEDDIDDQIENKMRLSQARLSKQRETVSAEAYGEYNKKSEFITKLIAKLEDQISRIKARVLQSFLFNCLEGKDLSNVIGAMEEKTFSAGEYVIKQGDNGEVLYIVETGELDCFKKFVSNLLLLALV